VKHGLICALLAVTAAHAETSFYGVTVGKPLSDITECPTESYMNAYSYSARIQYLCYQQTGAKFQPSAPIGNGPLNLKWPRGQGPEYSQGDSLYVMLVDGRVEAIRMGTFGQISQQLVYSALIAKFGQPAKSTVEQVQNGYGAKFDAIRALWLDGEVTISFDGVYSNLEHGLVSIESPTGKAAMKSHMDKVLGRSAGPKM
jgi:hypothetical protein